MKNRHLIFLSILLAAAGALFYFNQRRPQIQSLPPSLEAQERHEVQMETASDGTKIERHKIYYPHGQLWETYTSVNGLKQGLGFNYYANGKIRSEDNYKDDKLEGYIKRYQENGHYFSTNEFKGGLLNGTSQWYYPNGQQKSSIEYLKEKEHGYARFYFENGQMQEESYRIEGKLNGRFVQYYENGQLKEESFWKEGFKDGPLQQLDENGNLKNRQQYKNDKFDGYNEWYDEQGQLKTSANYVKGLEHGLVRWFNQDGFLRTSSEYQNGQKQGMTLNYYEGSDKIQEKKEYQQDVVDGTWATYYQNGNIQWVKSYKNNEPGGPMKLFHQNGRLLAEFDYLDNQAQIRQLSLEEIYNGDDLTDFEEKEQIMDVTGVLLASKDFERLEALAKDFKEKEPMLKSGRYRMEYFYKGLRRGFGRISVENHASYLEVIQGWMNHYSDSITAKIALMDAYRTIAWDYRGTDHSNTISDQSRKIFKDYLTKAREIGQEAVQSKSQDPDLYAELINIGMGQGITKKETYNLVIASSNLDPAYYPPYLDASTVLLPRWYGDQGDLEEYAQWALERTKKFVGHEIYTRIAMDVLEYVGADDFKNYNFSWEDLKTGFEELLNKYPKAQNILHAYAWFACQRGEKETAKRLFTNLGDQWDELAKKIWKDKSIFDQWKAWALEDKAIAVEEDIHVIARVGDYATFKEIVDQSKDLNIQNALGQTPLHIALDHRQYSKASYLIQKGVKLDILDNQRREPLHLAAESGSYFLVKELLSLGAAPQHRDDYGFTPLHYAARSGFKEIVELLSSYKEVNINEDTNYDRTPLFLAADNGHSDVVKFLLSKDFIDVNFPDAEGLAPLHAAAQKGFLDIVKMLVAHTAKTDLKDKTGKTAADYAQMQNHRDVYKYLLDNK